MEATLKLSSPGELEKQKGVWIKCQLRDTVVGTRAGEGGTVNVGATSHWTKNATCTDTGRQATHHASVKTRNKKNLHSF